MSQDIINSVNTKAIGFAPILKSFFDKTGIQNIIDDNVELDPRRKILTHGEASVAMITAILFQVFQLYKISRFAQKSQVLDVLFPHIESKEYFDDRLVDTLDAIYDFGIGNLTLLTNQFMIETFNINTNICHNDTTNAKVYGNCDNDQGKDSIEITYGYSKKKRKDLKQFIWSLSVSDDSAFPLFQQAYSGNKADVSTYVEQWHNLIDLLGKNDFLYVGDNKLVSKDNLTHIHNNGGTFVAPVPMYELYKEIFWHALDNHETERLIPYKDYLNRGFEVPLEFTHEEKEYTFRMIIIYDQNLNRRKQKTLERKVRKTEEQLEELSPKINKYKLKTLDNIEKAINKILKKNQTKDYFEITIQNDPITIYKNKKPGRAPKKGAEKIAITQDNFKITFQKIEEKIEQAKSRCGYYPLVTNQSSDLLSIEGAMLAHKKQYKSEHTNRRAKSSLKLEPICLHSPSRIEAILFLFQLALQIAVLIERSARKNIEIRDKGLDDFMPNRKDVRNPTSENLLKEFEHVVQGTINMPEGNTHHFISELTQVQKDILKILDIPIHYYQYDFLFNST